jgi:hypothetical protein
MTTTSKEKGSQISRFPVYKISLRPGVQVSRTPGRAQEYIYRSGV